MIADLLWQRFDFAFVCFIVLDLLELPRMQIAMADFPLKRLKESYLIELAESGRLEKSATLQLLLGIDSGNVPMCNFQDSRDGIPEYHMFQAALNVPTALKDLTSILQFWL